MTTVNTAGRFVGDWPKIGIRPAVDGRMHGVRESLEEQTRNMALRTAALIRDNLRHPDGTPVEVVVPGHNIGGVYEAAKVCRGHSWGRWSHPAAARRSGRRSRPIPDRILLRAGKIVRTSTAGRL